MWRRLVILISCALTIWLAIAVLGDKELLNWAKETNTINPVNALEVGNAPQKQDNGPVTKIPLDKTGLDTKLGLVGENNKNQPKDVTPRKETLEPRQVTGDGVGMVTIAAAPSVQPTTQQPIVVAPHQTWIGVRAVIGPVTEQPAPKESMPQNIPKVALNMTQQRKPDAKVAPTQADKGEPPPAD